MARRLHSKAHASLMRVCNARPGNARRALCPYCVRGLCRAQHTPRTGTRVLTLVYALRGFNATNYLGQKVMGFVRANNPAHYNIPCASYRITRI